MKESMKNRHIFIIFWHLLHLGVPPNFFFKFKVTQDSKGREPLDQEVIQKADLRYSNCESFQGKCKSPEKSDLANYLGVDKVVAIRAICIALQDSNADAPTRLEVQTKTLDVVTRVSLL
jgi:hypothetical protein